MAHWSNLAGTVLGYLRLGLSGVRLKHDAGSLAVRNAADSADAVVVPQSLGTGTRDGTKYLRDDGTWQDVVATAGGGSTAVTYYLDETLITAGNYTLSPYPTTLAETTRAVVCNASVNGGVTYINRYSSLPLGGTSIDGGEWIFHTYAAASVAGGVNEVVTRLNKSVVKTGITITFTGSGPTRTATASGGAPFISGDATASILTATLIRTPNQTAWISGFTSSSVVTVTLTDPAYANESGVSLTHMYYLLFSVTTGDIQATTPTLYETRIVQPAFAIDAADSIIAAYFGRTDISTDRTLTLYYNGSENYTHVSTPLKIRHNDLGGLNEGNYKHLTATEYAAAITNKTGTGVAVYQTSPTLVTPVLGTPSSGNLGSCTAYPSSALAGVPLTAAATGFTATGGTTPKTLTVDDTISTSTIYRSGGTDVAVADGGTGASTLTLNNVILGNNTSAVQFVAPSTSGNVLTSNGTTWTSAALAASSVSFTQNSKSADYTLVIGDAGKMIFHPATDLATRDWTIPSNASVAFPVGTIIMFVVREAAGSIKLKITSDILRTVNGLTGARMLVENTQYLAVKVASTEWLLSGGEVNASMPASQIAVAHDTSPYITAYPWSSSGFGTKFTDPGTLPTGVGYGVAFSPAGTEIAVAHNASPYITAYPWSSSGFGTKFTNPGTLPTGVGYGVAFSPAGTEIAVAHNASPYITTYPWSASGFGTKFTNPGTLPTGVGYGVAFSPAGTEIAVAHDTSPYITAYPWSSSGFGTKFTNPGTLPTFNGQGVAFSPAGTEIAVAHYLSPYITAYPWSASGFGTKFADPGTLPTGVGYGVAFSPAGTEIAVAHNGSPRITAYPWSASGFGTKFTNPGTLPTGIGRGVAFSPAGTEIAVAHDTSPYITAYPWSSSGFGTKFTDPGTLPTGVGYGVAFNEI